MTKIFNQCRFLDPKGTIQHYRELINRIIISSMFLLTYGCAETDDQADTVRTATLLTVNDTYRLTGPDRGKAGGGMARLAALRQSLESEHPDLLMLHGGDFISPSLLARTYYGEAMIQMMNMLDGDGAAQDDRMFAVLGNHEFDASDCSTKATDEAHLVNRIEESGFRYLGSNFGFVRNHSAVPSDCAGLSGLSRFVDNNKFLPSVIKKSGDLTLGIYGLTISDDVYKQLLDADLYKTSCEMVRELRQQGVDVVVALTHLDVAQDLKLIGLNYEKPDSPACTDFPDLIIGGHDHLEMAMPPDNPRIFKADADALSAYQVTISLDQKGEITVTGLHHELTPDSAEDERVARLADKWFTEHDTGYCQDVCDKLQGDKAVCLTKVANGLCLSEKLSTTATILEAEEIANRSKETGFGSWLTDGIRETAGADVSLLNAGGIRLNYNIQANQPVLERHIAEMFPYNNNLVVTEVPTNQIWNAVEYAVSKPKEGAWFHFSGLRVTLDTEGELSEIRLVKNNGELELLDRNSVEPLKVTSIPYVLAGRNKHGFTLCTDSKPATRECEAELEEKLKDSWPESSMGTLVDFVRQGLKNEDPVSFKTDGRLATSS